MEVNLPVWGYYPPNNEYFVDPLYVPYMNNLVKTKTRGGYNQICEVNPWPKQGPPSTVNPGLVRQGWGMSFLRMHPDKDPCPPGFVDGGNGDGWCLAEEPEFGNHGLYSEYAFVPKYQYHGSYAPRLKDPAYKEINQFTMRSVHPETGEYVVYFNPAPASNRGKYGYLPAKDSYLA